MRSLLRVCAAAALLALPATLAAQSLDSLFAHAIRQARARTEQIGARRDGGNRQYQDALRDLEAGQFEDALLSLQAAMSRGRDNPLYLGEAGYAHARLGHWTEAADAWGAAARLQRENPWWVVGLAGVRVGQADWGQAAGTFELAVTTDSAVMDGSVAPIAGQAYEAAGDMTRATAWYRRATELAPQEPSPFLRLAPLLWASNEREASIAAIRQYLTLRPDDRQGQAVLAQFLAQMGRTDSALAMARRAAADSSARSFAAEVFFNAAVGLTNEGELDRALAILREGEPWAGPELRPRFNYLMARSELRTLGQRIAALQETENCEGTRPLDSMIARVDTLLRAGRSADSARTDTYLNDVLPGYRSTAQQMSQRYCAPRPQPQRRRRP